MAASLVPRYPCVTGKSTPNQLHNTGTGTMLDGCRADAGWVPGSFDAQSTSDFLF